MSTPAIRTLAARVGAISRRYPDAPELPRLRHQLAVERAAVAIGALDQRRLTEREWWRLQSRIGGVEPEPEPVIPRPSGYQAARDAVFGHYGRICACCGTSANLTIDHVDGSGRAHRIEIFGHKGSSSMFYHWLIRSGFPGGYQVLCGPCNSSKGVSLQCRLDHSEAS